MLLVKTIIFIYVIIKEYIKKYLNEVRWEDSYRKGFIEFRKKYSKLINSGLYVRFSYTGDVLDRNANPQPDHSDPVGIYAYPLKYVVNNPSDIWYGRNSKYIQVLKSKSKNPLYLSDISQNELNSLFYRMKIDHSLIEIIRKNQKFSGSTMYGKIFFFAVQHDLSSFDKKEKTFAYRTPQEQTKVLNSLGFDAIIENSNTNKKAIINDREPEQIIFLNRYSFEIIDIFNLNLSFTKDKDSIVAGHHIDSSENHKAFVRKLAQSISEILGSRLKQGGKQEYTKENIAISKTMFWTADGQQIIIDFILPPGFIDNRKFGEKKHKEYKLYDYQVPTIQLITKKGKFNHTFQKDTSFKTILKAIKIWFDNKEEDPSFEPSYKEDYIRINSEERQKWISKEREKRNIQKISDSKEGISLLNKAAKMFNVDFYINPEIHEGKEINQITDYVNYYFAIIKNISINKKKEDIDWVFLNSELKKYSEMEKEDGNFSFMEIYEDKIKEILQKIFMNENISISYIGQFPWGLKNALRDIESD